MTVACVSTLLAFSVQAQTPLPNMPLRLTLPQDPETPRAPEPLPANVTRAQVYTPVKAPLRDETALRLPSPFTPPLETLQRRRRDPSDPYAPLGIDLGAMDLFPILDVKGGVDNNPNRLDTGAKRDTFLDTRGEARLQSRWLLHDFSMIVRGGYLAYKDTTEQSRPDGDARANLRLDVSTQTSLEAEARSRLDTQRTGSNELNLSARERPYVFSSGATLGAAHRFNRFSLGVRSTLDQTVYDSVALSDGNRLSLSDRNQTQYGVRLRAAYELTPDVQPFVEIDADTRRYERTADRNGFKRNSDGIGARIGTSFLMTRTLTGEASVLAQIRDYQDPRLKTLQGTGVDASLVWSLTPITQVRVRAATTLDESSLLGASGAITRRNDVEITHDFSRQLTGTLRSGVATTRYQGVRLNETAFTFGSDLEYRLTRTFSVRGDVQYERVNSSVVGGDYHVTQGRLGVRVQR
jgi:hypothetical protein